MLKKISLSKILVIILVIPVSAGLAYVYEKRTPKTAQAFGTLTVDFGVPPTAPIFDFNDFKPGDCAVRSVGVTNDAIETEIVAIRSDNDADPDSLATQLSIIISEDSNDLYGGTSGAKSLAEFYSESNPDGIALSELPGGQSTTYDIEICFDFDSGNEYQKTSTVFDLIFGTNTPPIILPPECKHLEGIITEKIEGTEGNDKIHGSTANELIISYGGNDRIDPSSGSDCIITGPGNDRVQGTTGDEVIIGGEGNDRLDGGTGNDIIIGGPGNDRLRGGKDNDIIYGDEGNDNINLGSGDDEAHGGDGNDVIRGGSGIDTIWADAGLDKVWGGSGNDVLDGGTDHDRADGDSGTDTCTNFEVLKSCEL